MREVSGKKASLRREGVSVRRDGRVSRNMSRFFGLTRRKKPLRPRRRGHLPFAGEELKEPRSSQQIDDTDLWVKLRAELVPPRNDTHFHSHRRTRQSSSLPETILTFTHSSRRRLTSEASAASATRAACQQPVRRERIDTPSAHLARSESVVPSRWL